jgi:hypothetical protein
MRKAADPSVIGVTLGKLQGLPIAFEIAEKQADELLQGRLVPVKQLAGSIDIGNIGISTHIDAAHRPVTTHLRSAIKIAHHPIYHAMQLGRLDWLGDVIIHTGHQAAIPVTLHCMGRHGHDRR